jgi:hypothetical protein
MCVDFSANAGGKKSMRPFRTFKASFESFDDGNLFGHCDVETRTCLKIDVVEGNMSECLHCDIHRLLKAATENEEMTLADVTDKVTQVLADLIAAFPVGIRSQHLGYTLGCLVQSIVEHGEPVLDTGEAEPQAIH